VAVEDLPDVRDGLTRLERIVLLVLEETTRELNGRAVPTAMLYGRVVERVAITEAELQRVLRRLMPVPGTGGSQGGAMGSGDRG
jgi:hypothetical protein